MLKLYYRLIKPGIIYGNTLTLLGGFFLASRGFIDGGLLLATAGGTALVMASGCVFNNYIDRDIDKKMPRTQKRALVTGSIPTLHALLYGLLLGLGGFFVLAVFVNTLTLLLGAIALFSYVILYGIAKRRSIHGTLVGTLPGALPPVAGYTAITNQLDLGAVLLFAILVLWQLAHFYAIAIYRSAEYKAASIPVLPLIKGVAITKKIMVLCMAALFAPIILLYTTGYAGPVYIVFTVLACIWWLVATIREYSSKDDNAWAKKTFFRSLIVLTTFSISLCVDAILSTTIYNVSMILIMHIAVALLGLAYATYTFFAPTQNKLRVVYGLSGLTLASGTYLVISRGSHLLEACMTGLIYFSVIIFFVIAAQRKLATENIKH